MTTRIIDSDAINKRVFREIGNLEKHSKEIRGENLKQNIDLTTNDLPDNQISNMSSIASDNFNFNGIEMSKIKQLINYMQTHTKEFKFDVIVKKIDNEKKQDALSQYYLESEVESTTDGYEEKGKNAASKVRIDVPQGFDGRNSFVFPRIILHYFTAFQEYALDDNEWDSWKDAALITLNLSQLWTIPAVQHFVYQRKLNLTEDESVKTVEKTRYVNYRVLEQNESFLVGQAMQGDANDVNCWSAPIKGSGNKSSQLIVDKNKDIITVSCDANFGIYNIGFDNDGDIAVHKRTCKSSECNHKILNVYLETFVVYWRDK